MREAWLRDNDLRGGTIAVTAPQFTFGRKGVKRSFWSKIPAFPAFSSPGKAWLQRGIGAAGTLMLITAAAALASDGSENFSRAEVAQWRAAGTGPDMERFMRLQPTSAVVPIEQAPERTRIDLGLNVGQGGIRETLVRAGAKHSDAAAIASMIDANVVSLAEGTPFELVLGKREGGRRPVEKLAMRAGVDLQIEISRSGGGLSLRRIAIPVDDRPLRLRGRAGDGLYFALRAAGASPQTAADYLKVLSDEIDVGAIGPNDRFDLVFANRKSADGAGKGGHLLYAGIDRVGEGKLQLVRWSARGKPVWVNAGTIGEEASQDEMIWPVNARITSRFGRRIHPILRFARMHRGLDFGAATGTPIRAAADGHVTRAGWAGGYGRQVRLAHEGGLGTSYSHMSSIAVANGTFVQRGQVIGYVGSSGLSTGPHLHYEVYRGGQAIDPLSVRFVNAPSVDPAVVAAIKARLKQLTSIGTRREG